MDKVFSDEYDVLMMGRRNGKTIGLVKHAAANGLAIVCYSRAQKARCETVRDDLGCSSVNIMTLDEMIELAEKEQAM